MKAKVISLPITISLFFLLIFLYFLLYVKIPPNIFSRDLAFPIIGTYLLIGFITIINLLQDIEHRPYSLNSIFWLFNFSFFFLSPLTSYLTDSFLVTLKPQIILLTNILILCWSFIFMIVYSSFISKKSLCYKNINKISSKKINEGNIKNAVFISIFASLFLIFLFGFQAFLTRGLFESISSQKIQSLPLLLIIRQFIRSFPVVTCGALLLFPIKKIHNKIKWYFLIIVLILLTVIIANPLGASRSWIATGYLGLFCLLLLRKKRNGAIFLLIMLIGLFVIFPFLNLARHLFIISELEYTVVTPKDLLTQGSFDAYENIGHTIELIQGTGIKIGRQLLGALLVFIPRSIWHNKPVGSGAVVGKYLQNNYNYYNKNLANSLLAEGYLNFGIFGVLLFAFVLGKIIAALDSLYYNTADDDNITIYKVMYPFLLGNFFFILRGDFMSSFAYTVAFILASIIFVIRIPRLLMIYKSNK